MVTRADGKGEIRFKDRLVTFEELDDEVTRAGLEEARAIPQEELDATIRRLGLGDRLDQVRERGSVTRHLLMMLLVLSLGAASQVALWAVDTYAHEHNSIFEQEAPLQFVPAKSDDHVPFVGKFKQVFAGPDDPFPGEDIRAYCAMMASAYSTMLRRKEAGMALKDIEASLSIHYLAEPVEVVRAVDQARAAFASDDGNDTLTWFTQGQECMDRRLKGTWYTYDWRSNPDYPKPFDPKTQNRLAQPERTAI